MHRLFRAVPSQLFQKGSEAAVWLLRAGPQSPNVEHRSQGGFHVYVCSVITERGKKERLSLSLDEVLLLVMFNFQIHAKVEFQMLEGAMLALEVLNGLSVSGQTIKVELLHLLFLIPLLFMYLNLMSVCYNSKLGPL